MSTDDEKDGAECAGEEFAAEVMNFCASRVPCTMSYLKDPPAVTAEIMLTGCPYSKEAASSTWAIGSR
jgi:hypothetical protein